LVRIHTDGQGQVHGVIVDLEMTAEERELLELVTEFADERVRPGAAEADVNQNFGSRLAGEVTGLGVFAAVPLEYGGDGGPSRAVQLLLLEQLAGADAGLAFDLASAMGAIAIVEAAGTAAQCEQTLTPLARDTSRTAGLLYYEGFGRSPAETATTAHYAEGGRWKLDGEKRSVVRPTLADLTVVLAQVNGQLTAFWCDAETAAGIRVTRDDNAAGKLGLRSAHTGDVLLRGLELQPDALLGTPGSVSLHRALAWFRLTTAAIAIGVGVAAIEYATGYAKERVAFGHKIIDYQGVEFPLVESDMALDAARLNIAGIWEAVQDLDDLDEIARLTSAAYGVATAAATTATLTSVNTLGGHGYLADHPVERWYRDATTLSAIDFDPLMHTGAIA
jgi:alkylation response protein AidB-like acyl-CoA dehydrogenase